VRAVLELGGIRDVLAEVARHVETIQHVKAADSGSFATASPERLARARGMAVRDVASVEGARRG